jgi:hypothetical protein
MDASTEHAQGGPPDPAEGLDRPTPPGGPQRVDEPDTNEIPQPETQDVRPSEHDGRDPAGIDKSADTDPAPRDTVEENAETSLDQPSDGSGGE